MNKMAYIQLMMSNRATARARPAGAAAPTPGIFVKKTAVEDHLYLYDVIVGSKLEAEWWGGVCAEDFAASLGECKADNLVLHIDSPGGSVFAARSISSALRDHPANVIARVDGLAASAATLVAMAADNVVMGDAGSMMMIHKAWSWAGGNADDMLEAAALLEKIDGTIVDTYHTRTGIDKATLATMMRDETWLTAQEAVDQKFADSILESTKNAANHTAWNLSAFLNPPEKAQNSAQHNSDQADPAPPEPESGNLVPRARQLQRLRVAGLISR